MQKIEIGNKIIAIYGPTISRKTGLAVDVAKYVWGKYKIEPELILADSRKIYKDLGIGQVSIWEPYDEKIKIHMFKIVNSLEKSFSLYEYKTMVDNIITEIQKKNRLPILFGGSAIFISSVLENWNVPKEHKPDIDHKKTFGYSKSKYKYIVLIPDVKKTTLFRKIKDHVEENFKKGIFEEVKSLVKKYNINSLIPKKTENVLYKSLEYKEFLEYSFKNKKKLEEFVKKDLNIVKRSIASNLKDFARRQIRWVPKMKGKKYLIRNSAGYKKVVDEFLVS